MNVVTPGLDYYINNFVIISRNIQVVFIMYNSSVSTK